VVEDKFIAEINSVELIVPVHKKQLNLGEVIAQPGSRSL
jgi:hypothetical protein